MQSFKMSSNGDIYYYGRSIPVDKETAHRCWEKAAILGDVCATYKIADMYRNGDLPKDEIISKKTYQTAYELSRITMNMYQYPDAYLRVHKYCRDMYTVEERISIADEAVRGFQSRIDDGDHCSNRLLNEAKAIQKELEAEDTEF